MKSLKEFAANVCATATEVSAPVEITYTLTIEGEEIRLRLLLSPQQQDPDYYFYLIDPNTYSDLEADPQSKFASTVSRALERNAYLLIRVERSSGKIRLIMKDIED